MNVSLQNIDKVSALLTVKLEKADYQEKVDKSLKNFRQKAQIPGFRKGMVPMSLVKKMYGKSVLAEEVNKLLSDSVYKYIQDNKVNILGEPLPNEDKQKAIDFDTMEEFEFLFDIALAPEFKAEVAADDKVDYYTIDVTEEMVDNQVKAYTQRNGKYEKVDAYADNDMLKGRRTGCRRQHQRRWYSGGRCRYDAGIYEERRPESHLCQCKGKRCTRIQSLYSMGWQCSRTLFAAEGRQRSCCRNEIQLQLPGRGNYPFRGR